MRVGGTVFRRPTSTIVRGQPRAEPNARCPPFAAAEAGSSRIYPPASVVAWDQEASLAAMFDAGSRMRLWAALQRPLQRLSRGVPAPGSPAIDDAHRCCPPTAAPARRRGQRTGGMAWRPAQTRLPRQIRGAVVRGATLTSAVVGELEGGTVVVAAAAPNKTGSVALRAAQVASPASFDTLQHEPRRPAALKPKPIIERTKTVTVKSRADLKRRPAQGEARWDAGLRDEGLSTTQTTPTSAGFKHKHSKPAHKVRRVRVLSTSARCWTTPFNS